MKEIVIDNDVLELWRVIPEFSHYEVSNLGRIYNLARSQIMRTSVNNYGDVKITLKSNNSQHRYTRSVAQMVAEAFVEPPNILCDNVMVLDGNHFNVRADNLTWRPKWFVWKYTHQFNVPQPVHYHNLAVRNVNTDVEYNSIVEAGVAEGILFSDIWESTYRGTEVYPYRSKFEIIERV